MAFTTIQGSGATDATSYVGSSGVDAILLQNTGTTGKDVRAQKLADTINFVELTGVGSNYSVLGGQGADLINQTNPIGFNSSKFNGNKDADTISITSGTSSTVYGGQGADSINSTALFTAGIFNGNKDNDQVTMAGGVSGSSVYGGQGTDSVTVGTTVSASTVQGNNDNDTLTVQANTTFGDATVNGNAGNDSINFAGAVATFTGSNIRGGAGNDTINAANNAAGNAGIVISGDIGNDSLTGSGNADTISTGSGTDGVLGGTGSDAITAAAGIDTISYTNLTDGAAFVAGSTAAGDTITGFGIAQDILSFTGNLGAGTHAGGVNQAGVNAIAYNGGIDMNAAGTGDDSVFLIASGAATATTADLVTLADLNTAIGTINNDAAADDRIMVFLAADNSFAAYAYTSDGVAAALAAGELQLLATGSADGAITAANLNAGA